MGRFQPFHKGHAYLIEKALDVCDAISIGIGSSDRNNDENPIDFKGRECIIKKFIQVEKISSRVMKIFGAPDVPDDNDWYDIIVNSVDKIDVIIGNNEWVNNIFSAKGYRIVTIPYYNRPLFEGKRIRQLIHDGKTWENRVPTQVVNLIKPRLEKYYLKYTEE